MTILEELQELLVVEQSHGCTLSRAQIGPDMARKLLTLSGGNRPLSKGTVYKYAKHMANHTWDESTPTQFIMFDKSGVLINGHHTLNAVIKSGETVWLYFMFNMDRSPYIDGGRTRSEADRFSMATGGDRSAVRSYGRAVAVCNILNRFTVCDLPTENDRYEFITSNLQSFEFLDSLHYKPGNRRLATAPIYSAVFLAGKNGADRAKLSHFWDVLQSGFMENPEDRSIIRLREWIKAQPNSSSTNAFRKETLFTTSDVLRKWLAGQPVRNIIVPEQLSVWRA